MSSCHGETARSRAHEQDQKSCRPGGSAGTERLTPGRLETAPEPRELFALGEPSSPRLPLPSHGLPPRVYLSPVMGSLPVPLRRRRLRLFSLGGFGWLRAPSSKRSEPVLDGEPPSSVPPAQEPFQTRLCPQLQVAFAGSRTSHAGRRGTSIFHWRKNRANTRPILFGGGVG